MGSPDRAKQGRARRWADATYPDVLRITEVAAALSSPARLAILAHLLAYPDRGAQPVALARRYDGNASSMMRHLVRLEGAGFLVHTRQRDPMRMKRDPSGAGSHEYRLADGVAPSVEDLLQAAAVCPGGPR
jgi:DNA-binding transcriptional ArsR family regulator